MTGMAATEAVEAGCAQARRLAALLEEEFDALRAQDLAGFEKLQGPKDQTLDHLGRLVKRLAAIVDTGALLTAESAPPWASAWAVFQDMMSQCESSHRRNEILIRSRLDTIKATLQVLQNGDSAMTTDLYDKLGRVGRLARGRGYEDA